MTSWKERFWFTLVTYVEGTEPLRHAHLATHIGHARLASSFGQAHLAKLIWPSSFGHARLANGLFSP